MGRLIPDDFDVHISEGSLWMLMNPQANKEHALSILADRMSTPLSRTVSFGDDLVDIAMLRESGRGVAVANANPDVLKIADEICPSNNDDRPPPTWSLFTELNSFMQRHETHPPKLNSLSFLVPCRAIL